MQDMPSAGNDAGGILDWISSPLAAVQPALTQSMGGPGPNPADGLHDGGAVGEAAPPDTKVGEGEAKEKSDDASDETAEKAAALPAIVNKALKIPVGGGTGPLTPVPEESSARGERKSGKEKT